MLRKECKQKAASNRRTIFMLEKGAPRSQSIFEHDYGDDKCPYFAFTGTAGTNRYSMRCGQLLTARVSPPHPYNKSKWSSVRPDASVCSQKCYSKNDSIPSTKLEKRYATPSLTSILFPKKPSGSGDDGTGELLTCFQHTMHYKHSQSQV